jgi:hypothetical protein
MGAIIFPIILWESISFLFAAEMELFPRWQNYFISLIRKFPGELDCARVNFGGR